jgi:hypothetical protein
VLERDAHRHAAAGGEVVGQADVHEIDVVDDLRAVTLAVLLLDGADEVAVRALFAEADGERPAVVDVAAAAVFPFCRTCRANHGRALTCGDSTLAPGVPRRGEEQEQERDARAEDGRELEVLSHLDSP